MWKRRKGIRTFVSIVIAMVFMASGVLGNLGNVAKRNVYATGESKYNTGYNVENFPATYTTVDGKQVSGEANGVATVLIFARTNGNCPNSNYTMANICKSKWATDERVRILVIDVDQEPVETVRARQEAVGGGSVLFCYDETYRANSNMWSYIRNTSGQSGSIYLPVTVLIDKNDRVQECLTGWVDKDELSARIEELLEEKDDSEKAETQKILPYIFKTAEGYSSQNASRHDYINVKRWTRPVISYLNELEDGSYQRLEAQESKGLVHVENYSADFNLTSEKTIEMELSIFGGYYLGKTHNYIVYGQDNEEEDTECEILRVVKYSKAWEREDSVSVKGANTKNPFESGSLSMTEANGKLYIHTCHKMFKSNNDGLNHQANMTYEVDETSMGVTQYWYNVMNIGYGYVSHSFNQFITTDGTNLYRLDHGDAYPRSLVITKCQSSSITFCQNKEVFPIAGTLGANDTGVMAGGFVLAGNQLVTAGNSVDQTAENWSAGNVRNIFVTSMDTGLGSTKTTWLTEYETESRVTVGNPHLVKASEEQLYVLWEEYDSNTAETMVKIAAIDAQGNRMSETAALYARLSDCVPVYTADDCIAWYVTGVLGRGATSPVFYKIATEELTDYPDDGRISLAAAEISDPSDATYTGQEIKPDVTVTYKGQTLELGTDYTLSYTDNLESGTAAVTITGQGKYRDSITKKFRIVKDPADDFSTTWEYSSLPNQTFSEEEFAFRVDFTDKGAFLEETQITIPAGDKWSGKKLYYYEIMEDGTYQYICRSTVTKAGNYAINLNHGSSYVASTKVPENLGNCDGKEGITSSDALAVLRYEVGVEQTDFDVRFADCDGKDGITSSDALAILRYEVNVIDALE